MRAQFVTSKFFGVNMDTRLRFLLEMTKKLKNSLASLIDSNDSLRVLFIGKAGEN